MNTNLIENLTFAQLLAISEITRISKFIVAEMEPGVSDNNLVFEIADIKDWLNALRDEKTVFYSDILDGLFFHIFSSVPNLANKDSYVVDPRAAYDRLMAQRVDKLESLLNTYYLIRICPIGPRSIKYSWDYESLVIFYSEIENLGAGLTHKGLQTWLYINRSSFHQTGTKPIFLDVVNLPEFFEDLKGAESYDLSEVGEYQLLSFCNYDDHVREYALPAGYPGWHEALGEFQRFAYNGINKRIAKILKGEPLS